MRGKFKKSIIVLVSGSLLAQIITLACSPIITRVYSAEQLGYFAFILSIVAMFSGIINGRYDISIVTAENDEVASLSVFSMIVALILSTIVTVVSYLYTSHISIEYFEMKGFIWFIFPLLIIAGIINVLNAYNNRIEEFKLMTRVYVIRSFWQNFIMVLCGIFKSGLFGLLSAQALGQLFGLKSQSEGFRRDKELLSKVNRAQISLVSKKYKDQLFFSTPATFFNALSYSLINIYIGSLYGMAILGLFSISIRVLGLPLNVFSANVSKVYYSRANDEIKANGRYFNSTKKTILLALILAIPIVLILITISPVLFEFIFGNSWREAGIYVQILAPMFGFRLLVGAVGYGFIIARKQIVEFIIQCTLLIILFVVVFISNYFNLNIFSYLLMISIGYSIVYVIELFMILYYSRKRVFF